MSDLTNKLREIDPYEYDSGVNLHEAAAQEIELLETQNTNLRQQLHDAEEDIVRYKDCYLGMKNSVEWLNNKNIALKVRLAAWKRQEPVAIARTGFKLEWAAPHFGLVNGKAEQYPDGTELFTKPIFTKGRICMKQSRPKCTVRGILNGGKVMCLYVIVGGKECGIKHGECNLQEGVESGVANAVQAGLDRTTSGAIGMP